MKILNIILISIYIMLSTHVDTSYADSNIYGRIDSTYTYIYPSPSLSNTTTDAICMIESTYYVEILEDVNSYYYKVHYNGIVGYVSKDNISLVSGTPMIPYPNNIVIVTKDRCNLRSSPDTTSNNIICLIPENTSTLVFLGRTTGAEVVDYGGNTWYYVEYNGYKGYIYNKYIDTITSIYKNTEDLPPLKIDSITAPIHPLSSMDIVIYIVILSIPFVIILCILYIPPKRRQYSNAKHKY